MMECLHLHNPSLFHDIHRPDPETPNKNFHTTTLICKSQKPESTGNSSLVEISYQVTTDFSWNTLILLL